MKVTSVEEMKTATHTLLAEHRDEFLLCGGLGPRDEKLERNQSRGQSTQEANRRGRFSEKN